MLQLLLSLVRIVTEEVEHAGTHISLGYFLLSRFLVGDCLFLVGKGLPSLPTYQITTALNDLLVFDDQLSFNCTGREMGVVGKLKSQLNDIASLKSEADVLKCFESRHIVFSDEFSDLAVH